MAQTHKLLGRSNPAATTDTTLYTAPALTTTICSCLTIVNTDAADDTVRIFWVPNGGSPDVSNTIIYDITMSMGNPFVANIAHTLLPGDFISVYSLNGTTTFTASGLEIT